MFKDDLRECLKKVGIKYLFRDKVVCGYSYKFKEWERKEVLEFKKLLEEKGYYCKINENRYCRLCKCLGLIVKEK